MSLAGMEDKGSFDYADLLHSQRTHFAQDDS